MAEQSTAVVCRHCGGELVRAKTTARTKGWAHKHVQIAPGNLSPLEEACRINPVTLAEARGTTYAEPADG